MMPFKGSLKRGVQAQITVSAGASNVGDTGVYIEKVLKVPVLANAEFVENDLFTTAPNTSSQQTPTYGNTITRIKISVFPPPGGTAVVKVQQGVTMNEDPVSEDTAFVYDVVS
jgi:hypothetical protein